MDLSGTEIDRMLSVKETAVLIGMKSQTLDKWRMQGNSAAPAFTRIGRSIRYKVSTIQAWMKQQPDHQATQREVL